MKPIDKLKPAVATPEDEMCRCAGSGPIMLRSALAPFPVYCMRCNGEMPLEALALSDDLAERIAAWRSIHDALFRLWLHSGEYEEWAKARLLDTNGQVNVQGLALAKELNVQRPTFFWFFQDTGAEGGRPPQKCPFCGGALEDFENRNYRVCRICQVAL